MRREDFWNYVDESAGPGACWPWTLSRTKKNYGQVRIEGAIQQTHRVAFRLANPQAFNPKLNVCHTCDNPPCCNPTHLWQGTPCDNTRDMIIKGRKIILRGSDVGGSKLHEDIICTIRKEYDTGLWTQQELATVYGVSQTTIGRAIRGVTWK